MFLKYVIVASISGVVSALITSKLTSTKTSDKILFEDDNDMYREFEDEDDYDENEDIW